MDVSSWKKKKRDISKLNWTNKNFFFKLKYIKNKQIMKKEFLLSGLR